MTPPARTTPANVLSITHFTLAGMQAAEQACAARLAQEPGDTAARLRLAWCLAMQACFEAGREQAQMSQCAPDDRATPAASAADFGAQYEAEVVCITGANSADGERDDSGLPATDATPADLPDIRTAVARDSRRLLQNSLRQAGTVAQLSLLPQERDEAAHLRALVSDCGGDSAVAEADASAAHRFARLAEAIWDAPGDEGKIARSVRQRFK